VDFNCLDAFGDSKVLLGGDWRRSEPLGVDLLAGTDVGWTVFRTGGAKLFAVTEEAASSRRSGGAGDAADFETIFFITDFAFCIRKTQRR
jgi:hypothetical protein